MTDSPPALVCPAPEGASESLARVDGRRRIAYLDAALTEASIDASNWGRFWRATFQTTAVAGFVVAPFFDKKADRVDSYASGAKSTVGWLFASIFTLPAERHRDREPPKEASCDTIASLERTLAADGEGERKGRGIGMHVLGGVFNVAVGVTVGLIHHRWWTAISGMAIGGAVGELRIFTQPTTATDAYARYVSGELATSAPKPTLSAAIVPLPGGAAASFDWTF
jgi:hypothetical protein